MFCFLFQVLFTSRRAHVSVISVQVGLPSNFAKTENLNSKTFDDFAFQGFTQCANIRGESSRRRKAKTASELVGASMVVLGCEAVTKVI